MPTGLPPGLGLNASTGVVSGTPVTAGTYTFTVKVTDAAGRVAYGSESVEIRDVQITGTLTSPAEYNAAYSDGLDVSGGVAPYTWTLVAGTLPTGLSLDSGTGLITGTPTVFETKTFTLRATDVNADYDESEQTVYVAYTGINWNPAQSPLPHVTLTNSNRTAEVNYVGIFESFSSVQGISSGILVFDITKNAADCRFGVCDSVKDLSAPHVGAPQGFSSTYAFYDNGAALVCTYADSSGSGGTLWGPQLAIGESIRITLNKNSNTVTFRHPTYPATADFVFTNILGTGPWKAVGSVYGDGGTLTGKVTITFVSHTL